MRALLAEYSALKLSVRVKYHTMYKGKHWPSSKLKGETAAVVVALATALL